MRQPYHREAVKKRNRDHLRLSHKRRGLGRDCGVRSRSSSVEALSGQFADRMLLRMSLAPGWKARIIEALREESEVPGDEQAIRRLQTALKNLRKQHMWGNIDDDE